MSSIKVGGSAATTTQRTCVLTPKKQREQNARAQELEAEAHHVEQQEPLLHLQVRP